MVGKTSLYAVRPVLNSVNKKKYDDIISLAREECKLLKAVKLLSDGQFSKVVWSAQYCTYYMVESTTRKILDQ